VQTVTDPIDTDQMPPTQILVLEVLAARYRCGEKIWTFPTSLNRALLALQSAGLVHMFGGAAPKTVRARLTDKGLTEVLDLTYTPPSMTLAQAIDTLPTSNEDLMAWAREHGLGLSAGVGAVIAAIRMDLRKLPGGRAS
jgi:hypothetical protein